MIRARRRWPVGLMRAAVAAGLLLLLPTCAHLEAPPPAARAVEHRVTTADGWTLSLVRQPPEGAPRGRPVLLVHGIAANGRNLDFDEGHSLARWFARQGREAWTLSLRGTGNSDHADASRGRPSGGDFDIFWQEDLPAAIAYVREQSGADAIDYVGHSMGGMLVYAYLGHGGTGLHRVITLGSPTRLDFGSTFFELGLKLEPLVPGGLQVPTGTLARLSAPFSGGEDDPNTLLLFNPENVPVERWRQFMVTGVDDVSGGVLLQLAQMAASGTFGSRDGRLDHRAAMAEIDVPVLVVAGKLDRFCPPMAAWDAYRSLGGEKAWLLLARTHGAKTDYGHMDFVLGDDAPTELWPTLLAFLEGAAVGQSPAFPSRSAMRPR